MNGRDETHRLPHRFGLAEEEIRAGIWHHFHAINSLLGEYQALLDQHEAILDGVGAAGSTASIDSACRRILDRIQGHRDTMAALETEYTVLFGDPAAPLPVGLISAEEQA